MHDAVVAIEAVDNSRGCGTADCCAWVAEVRMVERVECLPPELKAADLTEGKGSTCSQIHGHAVRSDENVSSGDTEAGGRNHETACVKPPVDGAVAQSPVAGPVRTCSLSEVLIA